MAEWRVVGMRLSLECRGVHIVHYVAKIVLLEEHVSLGEEFLVGTLCTRK